MRRFTASYSETERDLRVAFPAEQMATPDSRHETVAAMLDQMLAAASQRAWAMRNPSQEFNSSQKVIRLGG